MKKMERIMIYGAGGFGREIACLINSINQAEKQWEFVGFIDDGLPVGTKNSFGTILGNLEYLNSCNEKLAVVISIAEPMILKKLTENITNPNIWYPNLIAPDVKFHDSATFSIGIGNILFFSCRISCNVSVGNFNLMNSLVSLGHDVQIGDRNVLNPAVRISGDCVVGDENFFGIHSIILQGLKIGNNTRVGVASVVMRNTKDNSLYYGNPAKKLES
jgi:sugar O-acyltransferase (sialic acid O-acetyltransferase NeuD family)